MLATCIHCAECSTWLQSKGICCINFSAVQLLQRSLLKLFSIEVHGSFLGLVKVSITTASVGGFVLISVGHRISLITIPDPPRMSMKVEDIGKSGGISEKIINWLTIVYLLAHFVLELLPLFTVILYLVKERSFMALVHNISNTFQADLRNWSPKFLPAMLILMLVRGKFMESMEMVASFKYSPS